MCPTTVYNRLAVTGDTEELARFVAAAEEVEVDEQTGERAPLNLRHVPTPATLLEHVSAHPRWPVRSPARDDGWFRWRRQSWGKKWNAMWPSARVIRRSAASPTSSRPPLGAWLRSVAALHPELLFELEFVEEFLRASGGGRWAAGELVERWSVDPDAADWVQPCEDDEDCELASLGRAATRCQDAPPASDPA